MPGPRIPRLPSVQPGSTAANSYRFGYLALAPIPFVSMIIAAVAMVVLYPRYRRAGVIAAENGRRAANWGITVLVVMFVMTLVITPFLGLDVAFTRRHTLSLPLWALMLAYLVLAVAHIGVASFGMAYAASGRVFRNPFAIPFIQSRPDSERQGGAVVLHQQ